MKTAKFSQKFSSIVKEITWQLAIPLGFLLLVLFFFPTRERFEFSTDEGLELIKAMLVARDYSLYDEIWNDQPPGLTYLVVASIKLFGADVQVARTVVLLLSCLLIWAISQILRTIWGNAHAIAGALLLIILPNYLILSVSVMRGLPTIAFAMLSLYGLVKWHDTHKYPWLVFSSLALGYSVFTKLFTGFLAPIFAIGLVVFEYWQYKENLNWKRLLQPAFVWGIVFTAVVLVLGLLFVGIHNVEQLLLNHLTAADTARSEKHVILTINWHLRNSIPFLVIAIIGAVAAITDKKLVVLYPIAWSVTAYILLLFHYPVWDHHQHLITIPAVILAANAVALVGRKIHELIRSNLPVTIEKFLVIAAVIGLLAMFVRLPDSLNVLEPTSSISGSGLGLEMGEERFLYIMENRAQKTRWVVTDLPMYAYRVGLPVPPYTAVLSAKRYDTGLITDAEMLEAVQEYKPEQVLLGRFQYPLLESYLEEHYWIIHDRGNIRLYIRDDG
jgi:hypothetical protein